VLAGAGVVVVGYCVGIVVINGLNKRG